LDNVLWFSDNNIALYPWFEVENTAVLSATVDEYSSSLNLESAAVPSSSSTLDK
jgi:hypothetical protein